MATGEKQSLRQRRRAAIVPFLGFGLALSVVLMSGCQTQQQAPAAATKAPAPTAVAPAPAPTAPAPPAPTTAPASAPTTAPAPAVATTAPAPTVAAETLKIGISASLTGPGMRIGSANDRIIRFAIDDINAKGGIKAGSKTYRLEAVTADDRSTAEGGRDAGNKLVLQDKVQFVVGIVSGPLGGAQPLLDSNKVLTLAYTALDASLAPKFPLTFQAGYSHTLMRLGPLYDTLVQEHPQVKRIALLNSDDPAGRGIAKNLAETAKQHGLTVVADERRNGYRGTSARDRRRQ